VAKERDGWLAKIKGDGWLSREMGGYGKEGDGWLRRDMGG
jgi:hypothetical protein